MTTTLRTLRAIAIALLALSGPAAAGSHGGEAVPARALDVQTRNQVTFVSGGVGDREQQELRDMEERFTLRVALTDADGAFLDAARIELEDTEGRTLVDTRTRGPIWLARLEPGRYHLRASKEGRTAERRVVDVPRDENDTVRLYVALDQE